MLTQRPAFATRLTIAPAHDLNDNISLESAVPGASSEKLSEVCSGFCGPLFVAAVLRAFTPWTLKTRLRCGAAAFVLGLISATASEAGL